MHEPNYGPLGRRHRTQDALLGILSIIFATGLALSVIPENTEPAGALFWPAAILSGGLLLVPVARARQGILRALQAENVLVGGLIYWLLLDLLQGSSPLVGLRRETILEAFVAIGLMAVGIWLGAAGRSWRLPRIVSRTASLSINDRTLFIAVLVSFCLGIFHFASSSGFDVQIMVEGLEKGRFAAPWSRGKLGGWSAIPEHLMYFGYALPSLTVLLAYRRGWFCAEVWISFVLSIIMVLFLAQGGGRRVFGVVVGAAMISWLLLQRRLRLKTLIVAALLVGLILGSMETMLKYRNVGFQKWFDNNASSSYTTGGSERPLISVDGNFLRLSQIISIFPERHSYVFFEPVYHAAVRPIPRVLWPGKPIDAGYDLPKMIGAWGVSLSASIIGELYAMYGLVAVFFGAFLLGRLAGMWNRVLWMPGGISRVLVYALGLMTLFTALRSFQDLVIMSYGLLGWCVLAWLLGPKQAGATLQKE